jgi:hypothetical protein
VQGEGVPTKTVVIDRARLDWGGSPQDPPHAFRHLRDRLPNDGCAHAEDSGAGVMWVAVSGIQVR